MSLPGPLPGLAMRAHFPYYLTWLQETGLKKGKQSVRNCILFAGILIFVLFVNSSVIAFDLMYAEQPMLYAANQALHSIGDLLSIYLQPRMLDVFSIPFFRPSGHFLLYQILMPFLGWHNTQGLIIVNLT